MLYKHNLHVIQYYYKSNERDLQMQVAINQTTKEVNIPIKYKMTKVYSHRIKKLVTANLTIGQHEYKIRTLLNTKAEECNG